MLVPPLRLVLRQVRGEALRCPWQLMLDDADLDVAHDHIAVKGWLLRICFLCRVGWGEHVIWMMQWLWDLADVDFMGCSVGGDVEEVRRGSVSWSDNSIHI